MAFNPKRPENEREIARIGGRLADDFYTLQNEIEVFNRYYWGLFVLLGVTENTEAIIDIIINNLKGLQALYSEQNLKDIEEGKKSAEDFPYSEGTNISLNTSATPEEKARREIRSLKTRILNKYKALTKLYEEENHLTSFTPKYDTTKLDRCRSALYITPSGVEIDGEKYIAIYTDYMAGDQSKSKQLQQAAADAINRFFNGAVDITESELKKYFILKDGIIQINPKSISKEAYARLGKRTIKHIINNGK